MPPLNRRLLLVASIISIAAGCGIVELRAEAVLVAMGRKANTEGLGLEDIGVHVARRGVIVDERMRTTQKHIFAPGDVNGRHQFTHAAGYEGGLVVSNAVIHFPSKADYTWMPRCTYTDPELACIGRNERALQADGLRPGQFRPLKAREVEKLMERFVVPHRRRKAKRAKTDV